MRYMLLLLLLISTTVFARPNAVFVEGPKYCGTAFPVTSDGYFVTANHVVSNTGYVLVWLEAQYLGKVVARDTAHDLALIKVIKTGIEPFGFEGNIAAPYVVRGFPEDMANSVVTGRATGIEDGMLQLEGHMCHGHSGAPVVDSNTGLVIGVVDRGIETPGSRCGETSEATPSSYVIQFLKSVGVLK